MLKVILSQDRKSARVYFETHSVTFHSDVDVVILLDEILFAPSRRLLEKAKERETRLMAALEDTQEIEIDPQLSFKDVA